MTDVSELFERAHRARGYDRRRELIEALRAENPAEVLRVAFDHYHASGNGDRLTLAVEAIRYVPFAAMLQIFTTEGANALPFVASVCESTMLSTEDKKLLLDALERHDDEDVVMRVAMARLELRRSGEFPPLTRTP